MARTAEAIVQDIIGQLVIQLAAAQAELESLRERAALKEEGTT